MFLQRLVTNAEEVAFNDPPSGAAEQMILNQHLFRLLRHAKLSAFQRFLQQILDGFFVKYLASAVALLAYAAPLYFRDPRMRGSRDDLTQDYIRAMRLLQNTSRWIAYAAGQQPSKGHNAVCQAATLLSWALRWPAR